MAGLTLFLVLLGSALASSANIPAGTGDVAEVGSVASEISYDEAIEGPFERRRREAQKIENSDSQFIQSEKKTEDKIYWRDNSETRKQHYVPTVTKVLYHGIYPSLNVSLPANGSDLGKYRQTRSTTNARDTQGVSFTGGTVSTVEKQPSENMIPGTQGVATTRDTYPTPEPHVGQRIRGGDHYHKADHEVDMTTGYNREYVPERHQYAQGSIRYRTEYKPKDTYYQGDPENKGRVRLISVGYYSINESRADLRSYQNPTRKHPRTKRDTRWGWLDKVFNSIWIIKNPGTDERENEIPGSEPLRLEVSKVNEEAQDVYGYSSNGHSPHHNVDRIYLVKHDQNHETPITSSTQSLQPTTISSTQPSQTPLPAFEEPHLSESEEPPSPKDGPVLIQAPQRRIICRPPKRLARGRCRTVW